MKIFDVPQGEPAWFAARAGIPTASEFHRIITPKREQLAEGRWSYAFRLAAERLLGESTQSIDGLQWVERGKILEGDAVSHYEFTRGRQTAKVGFITPDHGRYGCSPDRLIVGKDGDPLGGLEIKCPSSPVHLAYFINGAGEDYRCQVQGSLMVTGFEFWDFQSYHPQLPEVLVRFTRDEPFIRKMQSALDQFCEEIDHIVEKVKEAGYVPTPERFSSPLDVAARAWEGEDAIPGIIESGWGG
jgi:hypothetical protein